MNKGPHHERIRSIKSSDPAIDRLINFRYYRLINTTHVCLAEESKKPHEQVTKFQATIEKLSFIRKTQL